MLKDLPFPPPFTLKGLIRTYKIVEKFRQGSCGAIYKTSCGLIVKVIPEELYSHEEFEIVTSISHPNMMHAIDVGKISLHNNKDQDTKQQDFVFYVMPMVIKSLEDMSRDNDLVHVSCHQKLVWVFELLDALIYLSNSGYIHGDIHPKNVLLHITPSFQSKLVFCDFNLSHNIKTMNEWIKFLNENDKHDNLSSFQKQFRTSTPPFSSPLSLYNNEYWRNKSDFDYLNKITKGDTPQDEDLCLSDVFAFAQLVTYILFNGDSFLGGYEIDTTDTTDVTIGLIKKDTNIKQIVQEYKMYLYAEDHETYFKEWYTDKVETYYKNVSPETNEQLEQTRYILNHFLRIKQADRNCFSTI